MEIGHTIPVLDHGYVKLIGTMGTDETIIEAARMSTNKGFEGWDKDAKLLEFLYKHSHMTPFEMCELSIEVACPLFVRSEWHRHRTWSYNELSARYTQMPDVHYLPSASRIKKQSKTNKQGSAESLPEDLAKDILKNFEHEQSAIYAWYDSLVKAGVAKEIARINTPMSRYTRFRAKTDLRNVLGFLALRKPENAQWEIRQYADAIGEIVKEKWPRTYALFEEYTLNAVKLSASEAAALRFYLNERGATANEGSKLDSAFKNLSL